MISKNAFKISGLSSMTSDMLSDNDLFLVSDADDPKTNTKYQSKSLSFKTLNDKIASGTIKNEQFKKEFKTELTSNMQSELSIHTDKYVPILSWYNAGEEASQDYGLSDNEIVLSCGKAF